MPKSKKDKKSSSKSNLETKPESGDLELMTVKVQRDNYALKLRNVGTMLVNEMAQRWRTEKGIGDSYDAAELSNDVLMQAMRNLVRHRRENFEPLECRLTKAEETITLLICAMTKLRLKCGAYEKGLKEIVKSENLVYIKDKVATLRVIAGEKCHTIEFHDDLCSRKDDFRVEGVTNRQDDHAARILDNMTKLQIIPPAKRMPADTKLEYVENDLMLLVAKEMNQERVSCADWRMLAKLIGVDCEKLLLWVNMQVKNPAQMVLDEWMRMDDKVTVTHLYNHLISPAIRNTLLCKVIRGYYDVM